VSISGVSSRANGVPDVFRGGNAAPAESPEKARRRGKEAPRFVGPLSCANEFNGSNGRVGGFRANPEGVRERSSICPQTP